MLTEFDWRRPHIPRVLGEAEMVAAPLEERISATVIGGVKTWDAYTQQAVNVNVSMDVDETTQAWRQWAGNQEALCVANTETALVSTQNAVTAAQKSDDGTVITVSGCIDAVANYCQAGGTQGDDFTLATGYQTFFNWSSTATDPATDAATAHKDAAALVKQLSSVTANQKGMEDDITGGNSITGTWYYWYYANDMMANAQTLADIKSKLGDLKARFPSTVK